MNDVRPSAGQSVPKVAPVRPAPSTKSFNVIAQACLALESLGWVVGIGFPIFQIRAGHQSPPWVWPCAGLALLAFAHARAIARRSGVAFPALLAVLWLPALALLIFPRDLTTIEFGPVNDWLHVPVAAALLCMTILAPLVLRLRARAGDSLPAAIQFIFAAALAAAMLVVAGAMLLTQPGEFWLARADLRRFPLLAFLLAAYVLIALGPTLRVSLFRHRLGAPLQNILLAGCLFAAWLAYTTPGSGDKGFWLEFVKTPRLFYSELLGSALLHACARLQLQTDPLGPLFGVATTLAFLWFCDRHIACDADPLRRARVKSVCALVWLATGLHLVFFRGFVETTYPGLPFLILALHFLLGYLPSTGRAASVRLILAAALLGVAALFHGQFCFLFPAFVAVILFRNLGRPGRLLVEGLLATVTILAFFFLTDAALKTLGLQPELGNYWGGGDGARFCPLDWGVWVGDHALGRAGIHFYPVTPDQLDFTLFAGPHWRQWLNILLLGAPSLPLAFAALAAGRRDPALRPTDQPAITLGLFALCYVLFIFFWHFDLGYPDDVDLMLTMSLLPNLWLLAVSRPFIARHPRGAAGFVFFAAASSWAVVGRFLH